MTAAATPYLKARPTTYKGIQMRSRLEARAASLLDSAGIDWTYEPRAYKGRDGEYLPDFQIGPRSFLEVKPYVRDHHDIAQAAIAKALNVLSEALPGAWLWVIFSDGDGGALGPLGLPGADYRVTGHVYFCAGCRRLTFRGFDADQVCLCGGALLGVEGWLEGTGPAPA